MGGALSIPDEVKNMSTNKDAKFTVEVVYCSGWGYVSQYNYAEECLKVIYPNVVVNGSPT